MGLYTFKHPKTKKTVTVIQKMEDIHEYVDNKGVKWERVFESPNTQVTEKVDPFSMQAWMRKTQAMKGTVGDLWDMSAELSEQRKKVLGKDPVKEKAVNAYEKKTKKKHPLA